VKTTSAWFRSGILLIQPFNGFRKLPCYLKEFHGRAGGEGAEKKALRMDAHLSDHAPELIGPPPAQPAPVNGSAAVVMAGQDHHAGRTVLKRFEDLSGLRVSRARQADKPEVAGNFRAHGLGFTRRPVCRIAAAERDNGPAILRLQLGYIAHYMHERLI
jgi:hypothetical protein